MKIYRSIAILLPQLIIFLHVGAKFDLLFGFNRTSTGLDTLLLLLVLAPAITLIWFIIEIVLSIRLTKRRNTATLFLMPGLALLFFLESLGIDIFIVLQFKM